MDTNYAIIFIGIAIVAIAMWIWYRPPVISENDLPRTLDAGWQFYSKPTTLEPPGTIFRITSDKKKYIVEVLEVKTMRGEEAFGRSKERLEASIGIVAQLLGLRNISLKVGGEKHEEFFFEISNPVRELCSDVELKKVLEPFWEKFEYKENNRYFVIRENRTATQMEFYFRKEAIDNLGGEGSLKAIFSVKGSFVKSRRTGKYIIKETFNQPLGIMFLAEEIIPLTEILEESLEFGRVPVTEPLFWEEA